MLIRIGFVMLGLVVLGTLPGFAQPLSGEHVLEMYRRDRIHADKSVTVTQFLRVLSNGEAIRWGFERTLRTSYHQGRIRAEYTILDVRRNGRREPYRLVDNAESVTIVIGDPAVMLPPGEHHYCLSYRYTGSWPADANLAEVHLYDEFWKLPVARIAADVITPPGSEIQSRYAIGLVEGRDFASELPRHDMAAFRSLRPFAAGELFHARVLWQDPVTWPDIGDDKSFDECEIPIG